MYVPDELCGLGSRPGPHIYMAQEPPAPVGVPMVQERARQTLPAVAWGRAARAVVCSVEKHTVKAA
jgi:hypothetical protein